MSTDPLSDLLKTVRLTGAVFFEVAAAGSWAVASMPRELLLPHVLPGADHLIGYHVVTAGRCFASVPGEKPIALEAGQVIVFTHAQPHVMSSGPDMRAEPVPHNVLDVIAAAEKPYRINYGDGPVADRLVCGYLACDARPFNPLLDNLPPVMTAGGPQEDDAGWIAQFVRLAVAEATEKRAGSESVLTKLSELMFIDVVRRQLQTFAAEQAGWLAGLRDPTIGKVLAMMHARPAHDWTIDELARDAGLSRSVLAERFAELVSLPPMHYLARWRMQIAAELLSGSQANLAGIAAQIGYESEASFSRAFKKMVGVPPATWRRRARHGG